MQTAVQHSPGEVVKPEVAQRPYENCEISSTGGSEQAGDVLDEEPSAWSKKVVGDAAELEEEAGAVLALRRLKPAPLPDDAEVAAGEPAADEVDGSRSKRPPCSNVSDISYERDVRPVPPEETGAVRVKLDLENALMTSALKAEVEAAGPGEHAREAERGHT